MGGGSVVGEKRAPGEADDPQPSLSLPPSLPACLFSSTGFGPGGAVGGGGESERLPPPPRPGALGWVGGWVRARALLRRQAAAATTVMILPQVHLRKPCYNFYFL